MYPVFVELGPVRVHTFGVMVALGVVAGTLVVEALARRRGYDGDEVRTLNIFVFISVFAGGWLGHVVVNLARGALDASLQWSAYGLMFYGGLAGMLATLASWSRIKGWPLLALIDIYAIGGQLGNALGRWGCFFAGDDYGEPAPDLPWAVTFTDPRGYAPLNVPLHPTQLYLFANSTLLALVGLWLLRRRAFDGQVTAVLMMLYAVGRSVVEVFRGDLDRGILLETPVEISTSQAVSAVVFAAGVVLYVLAARRESHSGRERAK